MIKVAYIIQDIIGQGYWASAYNSFKGIVYATKFKTWVQAEDEILTRDTIKTKITQIVKIYYHEV